jgi:hypothetical protein
MSNCRLWDCIKGVYGLDGKIYSGWHGVLMTLE